MIRTRFNLPILAVLSLVACGGPEGRTSIADDGVENTTQSATTLGGPLSGLTTAQTAAFQAGKTEFATEEDVDEGLGLVFNERACGNCHDAGAIGGAGVITETRFGRTVNGVFNALENEGGSLIQSMGAGAVKNCNIKGEVVPSDANVIAKRVTTQLFGAGLVEAVTDQTLNQLAAREKSVSPGTAGRANQVPDFITGETRVGRFGWKAQLPTLLDFSAGAYLNEMGITSPFQPTEICPQGNCALIAQCDPVHDPEDDGTDVGKFRDFMQLLAPAPTGSTSAQSITGQALFIADGCTNCHTASLTTGTSSITALNRKTFAPYSDFLLHDMGTLGDGIAQDGAGVREIRTAPLWGARFRPSYLHDGRAANVNAAVLAHAGQAATARNLYNAEPQVLKSAILAFINTL